MKRLIAVFAACLMMAALLPTQAEASPFTFDAATGTITAYSGPGGAVDIPQAIGDVSVLAIGSFAFDRNRDITALTIPEGVRLVGHGAFYFCENLKEVSLPSSLEAIDAYAFFSTGISEVTFPANLASLGGQAFYGCQNLSAVRFQGDLPYIGKEALDFQAEGRVITVSETHLEGFTAVLGACQPGPYTQPTAAIPEADFQFDPAAGQITGYTGPSPILRVPAAIGGVPVTGIGSKAFFGAEQLRRVILPEGITSIGPGAFQAAKLLDAVLPEGLREIGDEAFRYAPLERINLPASLSAIGAYAFQASAFEELRVPEGITTLPVSLFQGNWKLKDVYLPASLTAIDESAFEGCDALSYLVFDGHTPPAIAPDAFKGCGKLSDVDIAWDANKTQAAVFKDALVGAGLPGEQFTLWRANHPDEPAPDRSAKSMIDDATGFITQFPTQMENVAMFWTHWDSTGKTVLDVRGLGEGVFENSAVKSFFVPHSGKFQSIGARAFKGSALETIHLFDSVTEIGEEAFMDCKNLKEIRLTAGITHIGTDAFSGCDSLERLVIPADAAITNPLGFPHEKIFVSADATEEQRLALENALDFPWYLALRREGEASAFARMPDSFTPNPDSEFEFDAATGTIKKYIGASPKVVIPRAIGGVPVTSIGELAFSNLSLYSVAEGSQDNLGLTEVIIPETLRRVADSAFLGCKALTRVACFGPLDYLGIRAFEECTALEEAIFHNGVLEAGAYAFNLCGSLQRVTYGRPLPKVSEGLYTGCGFEGLLTLDSPEIGNLAYWKCAGVTDIRVLPQVTRISDGAFQEMASLSAVWFDRADPSIMKEAMMVFSPENTGLKLYLPEDATDEQLTAFENILKSYMMPGEGMVERKNYPEAQPVSHAPAPVPAQAEAAVAPTQDAGGSLTENTYVCVSATSGGIALDLATIGEYAVRFSQDGTAVLKVAGTDLPPMPWRAEGEKIVLDYYGQNLVFEKAEEELMLDFFGSMMLTMKPE